MSRFDALNSEACSGVTFAVKLTFCNVHMKAKGR